MNKTEYLSRIGIDDHGSPPDASGLKMLQKRHLLSVPFENLDIHWNRPIIIDTEKFYEKIVGAKRGGFCYELNGLFNELLCVLGYQTRLVSARVSNGKGGFGPEFDHAAIIVIIGEEEYLADVGFGSFTAEPLRFVPDIEQVDAAGIFTIRRYEDGYFAVYKKEKDQWGPEYIFKPLGRDLSEFAEMCDFQQYSPDSHFKKGKLCSIMTETGRKTLTGESFIVTADGVKTEMAVESESNFEILLKSEFGIAN